MKNNTHNQPRGLFVNLKLPLAIKQRLDDATCGVDTALTKTGLITTLLSRYFDAVDRNRAVIDISLH